MLQNVTVFSPATVANLACGFDVLGLAVNGLGDTVKVSVRNDSQILISTITGDNGKLSSDPQKNTAGVAILALREYLRISKGFTIEIHKGLPLGSGLGSSAASSVGALVAVNELLGGATNRKDLLPFAIQAEFAACGAAHADNVAPALLGGVVLVRSYNPLDVVSIPTPHGLSCVLVTPHMELKTSDARLVLKKQISLADATKQWGNLAGLVAGFLQNDLALIGRSLRDDIVERERAILIPGFYEVKEAAIAAGALGCSISGSGPTIFALTDGLSTCPNIGDAMKAAFLSAGLSADVHYSTINPTGASVIAGEA